MQLDSDEDEQAFYKPPLLAPAPLLTEPAVAAAEHSPQPNPHLQQGGEGGQEAAAMATADQGD